MGNAEILVKGKNREILFNKLKRANIEIKKLKIVDEKTIIITVKEKDSKKVFAILGNVWYNKLIKYTGIIVFFNYIKKRIVCFIGILLFLVTAFYCKNLTYSIEINGISDREKESYFALLENSGVKRWTNVSGEKMEEVKNLFLSSNPNFSYVTVNKLSNRLIINVFQEDFNKDNTNLQKNIVSNTKGIIKKIVVFKGTGKKNIGDEVCVGDILIEGKIHNGEKVSESLAYGYVEIESKFFYEEKVDNFCEENKAIVVMKGKFLCSHLGEIEKVEVKENSQLSSYEILITYTVRIG